MMLSLIYTLESLSAFVAKFLSCLWTAPGYCTFFLFYSLISPPFLVKTFTPQRTCNIASTTWTKDDNTVVHNRTASTSSMMTKEYSLKCAILHLFLFVFAAMNAQLLAAAAYSHLASSENQSSCACAGMCLA